MSLAAGPIEGETPVGGDISLRHQPQQMSIDSVDQLQKQEGFYSTRSESCRLRQSESSSATKRLGPTGGMGEHALLQQISEAARNTGFLLSRFDGRRTGHVFLERNSNIARFRSDNTCLNKSSRRALLDLLVKVRQLRNSLAVTRAVALSQGIIAVTRLCELTVRTNAGLRVQTPK